MPVEEPDLGDLEDTAPLPTDSRPGEAPPEGTRWIGSYKLLYPIAEGGMGEVWLAEQIQPVRRKVAIKVIKAGMDTKQVVARFESERQALALMDHPAIAKVFEAGSTPEGRPYFVMEYVPGLPINDHCDRHKLSLVERLMVFSQVCEGVQHAHQKAIIHRDLKPSNILISLIDGRAQPKIIDFGIAKATGQRLTEKTLFTEAGALIGTPEYMSPEQADLTGQDIDTRTDVYSLGVVLYELLTGELPFGSKELRSSSYEEIRRKLREVDPPRPSTKLTTLTGDPAGAARNRATEPESLARELKGDLDAITMKALEKERARRYGTPSELAGDIARHLRHEPVLARAPSTSYRIGKYLKRHRLGVAVAGTIALLLASSTVLAVIQARRIAIERDRANLEAASARSVSEFLIKVFRVSNPNEARGQAVTARELLDKAAANVGAFSAEPKVAVRLLSALGEVYANLYQLKTAEETLRRAEALSVVTNGPRHASTLTIRNLLAKTLIYQGNYSAAEAILHSVIAELDDPALARNPDVARARNVLVTLLMESGRFTEGEQLVKQYLPIQRANLGPEHWVTLNLMENLGAIYEQLQRLKDAEAIYREIIPLQTRTIGPEHPNTISTLEGLGIVLMKSDRLAEAEQVLKEALARSTHVFGPDNLNPLAITSNLAETYRKQGRYDLAEATHKDVLQRKRRVLGPDNPRTIIAEMQVAVVLASRGDLDAAHRELEAVVEHGRRVLPRPHPQRWDSLVQLASVDLERKRKEECLDHLEDAVRESEEVREVLRNDPAWEPLRSDPRFQRLTTPPAGASR